MVHIHFPLSSHAFAAEAAQFAECAEIHGKFTAAHQLLYDKQDSIGIKSWESFADEIGIGESQDMASCAKKVDPGLIASAAAIDSALLVEGTPTVIINGWRYATPPYDSLDRIVARLGSQIRASLPERK